MSRSRVDNPDYIKLISSWSAAFKKAYREEFPPEGYDYILATKHGIYLGIDLFEEEAPKTGFFRPLFPWNKNDNWKTGLLKGVGWLLTGFGLIPLAFNFLRLISLVPLNAVCNKMRANQVKQNIEIEGYGRSLLHTPNKWSVGYWIAKCVKKPFELILSPIDAIKRTLKGERHFENQEIKPKIKDPLGLKQLFANAKPQSKILGILSGIISVVAWGVGLVFGAPVVLSAAATSAALPVSVTQAAATANSALTTAVSTVATATTISGVPPAIATAVTTSTTALAAGAALGVAVGLASGPAHLAERMNNTESRRANGIPSESAVLEPESESSKAQPTGSSSYSSNRIVAKMVADAEAAPSESPSRLSHSSHEANNSGSNSLSKVHEVNAREAKADEAKADEAENAQPTRSPSRSRSNSQSD